MHKLICYIKTVYIILGKSKMLSYSIKKMIALVLMLSSVISSNSMQYESLKENFFSILKNHPIKVGFAATLGIGTMSYYCYRNYLINSYKQALLRQQKDIREIKEIACGLLYPVSHGVH